MGRIKDETGNKYSKLTVIEFSHKIEKGGALWKCLCDCGNEAIVRGYCLRNGHTKSCGCLSKETKNTRHGHGYKGQSLTYRTWSGMLQRCINPNNSKFDAYGGRGIGVDERWKDFINFLEDMGERPEGMSLDRIDNDKGYSKENCRWVTKDVQVYNQRMPKANKSGKVGVWYDEEYGTYYAYISVGGKKYDLGTFKNFEEAVKVREEAELKYYGKLRGN